MIFLISPNPRFEVPENVYKNKAPALVLIAFRVVCNNVDARGFQVLQDV